jgi:hypothetical protein
MCQKKEENNNNNNNNKKQSKNNKSPNVVWKTYDEVNDTQVTHMNEATQTDEITESPKAHKKP